MKKNFAEITILFFLFLLILLNSLTRPSVSDPGNLDSSWQAVLQYAKANNLKVGSDTAFTYGPLGFLIAAQKNYTGYAQYTYAGLFLSILWGICLGIACFYLTNGINFFIRVVILLLAAFFQGWLHDPAYYFLLFSSAIIIMRNRNSKLLSSGFLLVFILFTACTLLALAKFTFFTLWLFVIALISANALAYGNKTKAFLYLTMFVLLISLCLAATNTSAIDFIKYLINSSYVASGYNQAMQLACTNKILIYGTISLLSLITLFFVRISAKDSPIQALSESLALAFTVFIAWKTAFVRADGHVMVFFCFALLCLCYTANVYLICGNRKTIFKLAGVMLATTSLLGLNCEGRMSVLRNSELIINSPFQKLTILANFPSHIDKLHILWKNTKTVVKMPDVTSKIGREAIDVLGHEQITAILNEWNYIPSPGLQSYNAYNSYIQKLNLISHIQCPRWILFKLQTIDCRLPSLNDSLLLRHILYNMKFAGKYNDFILLSPAKDTVSAETSTASPVKIKFGQWMDLGDTSEYMLWVNANFSLSLKGRLLELLFKSGLIFIEIELQDNMAYRFRYTPTAGEEGFLLSPLLIETQDIQDLLTGRKIPPVKRFRFISERGEGKPVGYKNNITIHLNPLPWPAYAP